MRSRAYITSVGFSKKAHREVRENRAVLLRPPPACSRDLFQPPPGWGARTKSDVSEGSSHFHPVCHDLNKSPKEVKSFYWINPLFVTFLQTDLMLVRHHRVTLNPRQPPYVVRVKQGWMDGWIDRYIVDILLSCYIWIAGPSMGNHLWLKDILKTPEVVGSLMLNFFRDNEGSHNLNSQ